MVCGRLYLMLLCLLHCNNEFYGQVDFVVHDGFSDYILFSINIDYSVALCALSNCACFCRLLNLDFLKYKISTLYRYNERGCMAKRHFVPTPKQSEKQNASPTEKTYEICKRQTRFHCDCA